MKEMRALILGDSLAIPRPKRGQHLSKTWPVLLTDMFKNIDIWQRCRPGILSDDVLREFHLFSESLDAFNFLVIQVGIGDCCPRPYPYFIYRILQALKADNLLKKINSWYPFLLRFRSVQWIPPQQFFNNFDQMVSTSLSNNPKMHITLIAIGEPTGELVKKVPGVELRRESYNQEMLSVAAKYPSQVVYIDPYENAQIKDIFLDDGHHLTVHGHALIAEKIAALWTSALGPQ